MEQGDSARAGFWELGLEKQIPFGNDSQKNKNKNKSKGKSKGKGSGLG